MKTFTKTMSMILIAVMCFSLFATSAYASDFSLDGSGIDSGFSVGDSAPIANFGDDGGFSLGDNFVDSAFNSGSSVAQTVVPAEQAAPVQQAEANSGDSFTLGETAAPKADASDNSVKQDDELVFEVNEILNAAYNPDTMKFAPEASDFTLGSTANIEITAKGFAGDSFKALSYSTYGNGDGRSALPSSAYSITAAPTASDNGKLIFLASWLNTLKPGTTYYFYGERTDELPIKITCISINPVDPSTYGKFTVSPSTYTQYASSDPNLFNASVSVTTTGTDGFAPFARFAVIPQGASSGGRYADGSTWISPDKKTLVFERTFLDGLTSGYYDIYGVTANGQQVKFGSVYIKAGEGGYPAGAWELWPDYSIPWTSGDDPLMFRSNLMAMRKTYPRYTIVPRYGFGAGSTPNNMIDVNQFWDMGDGVFALGTNFLRSLPAGTYTLQVVDYKHLNDCTNVVTFRIGSTLRPIDTDKHVIGSIKNLRFLCDEPVYEVYVGNIPLTYGEDYALSNGNKTITLSFEFLNKRSAGNTYTIKALTASGTYPSSTFQILSTAQGSASPRTGDESNLGLWAAFLLLSGAAVVVLVPKLRKHDF